MYLYLINERTELIEICLMGSVTVCVFKWNFSPPFVCPSVPTVLLAVPPLPTESCRPKTGFYVLLPVLNPLALYTIIIIIICSYKKEKDVYIEERLKPIKDHSGRRKKR